MNKTLGLVIILNTETSAMMVSGTQFKKKENKVYLLLQVLENTSTNALISRFLKITENTNSSTLVAKRSFTTLPTGQGLMKSIATSAMILKTWPLASRRSKRYPEQSALVSIPLNKLTIKCLSSIELQNSSTTVAKKSFTIKPMGQGLTKSIATSAMILKTWPLA